MGWIVIYVLIVTTGIYEFLVDYDSIDVHDILDIHKYLMEKHDIK